MSELEHRLKYGELSRNDSELAADVVSAYRELVLVTDAFRSNVVRQLRREISMRQGR